MNLVEKQFEGIKGAHELLELAKTNLKNKEIQFLNNLSEEQLIEFFKHNYLSVFIYIAAVKNNIISYYHESYEEEWFIDKDMIDEIIPELGDVIFDNILEYGIAGRDIDEIAILIYYNKETKTHIELTNMELETDDWYSYYDYCTIKDKNFFANKLYDIFKKHAENIIEYIRKDLNSDIN